MRQQTLAQVGLELVQRVELTGELGELVVGLGQLALLDRLDLGGDLGVLTRRYSPATSLVVKVLVSPSFAPMMASSMPSTSWPEPIS